MTDGETRARPAQRRLPDRDALSGRDRLVLALDVPTAEEAERLVAETRGLVGCYKIGLELVFAGGLDLAGRLVGAGERVFLDMKLHDIANTVERAVARVAALGVDLLTVHAYPQTMAAAVAGRGDGPTRLLGVTVLTSMDDVDLASAGYAGSVADTVAMRAGQAAAAGLDGLVASAREARLARAAGGPGMVLVTPGIRLPGDAAGDQKRVVTPGDAIRAGSDMLVVGRPVTRAADPRAAAAAVLAAIEAAEG